MWRDYVGLIPSTAAIVNGFIAVLVAQFFKDHPVARTLLVVAAGVLGIAAIGATFYSQQQIVTEKAEGEKRRHDIREALGGYIKRGNGLEQEAADKTQPLPIEATNSWDSDVVSFLQSELGPSYVTRYQDSTGINSLVLNNSDTAHQNLWWAIYTRTLRLEQFSDQFPY
jgi:hypothetical protein